jgi:hypothetical protein
VLVVLVAEVIGQDPDAVRADAKLLGEAGDDIVEFIRVLSNRMGQIDPANGGSDPTGAVIDANYWGNVKVLLEGGDAVGELLIDLGRLIVGVADQGQANEQLLASLNEGGYDVKLGETNWTPGGKPSGTTVV